jgi:hypothetical protein
MHEIEKERRVDDPRVIRIEHQVGGLLRQVTGVEKKIDTVGEKFELLVRIEERQANNQSQIDRLQKQVDDMAAAHAKALAEVHGRVTEVTVDEARTSAKVNPKERAAWGIISGSLALYVASKEFLADFFSRH